jgi:hypothetical protein
MQGGGGCEEGERAAETLPRGGHAEAHNNDIHTPCKHSIKQMEQFAGRWVLHQSHGLDAFLQVNDSDLFGWCEDGAALRNHAPTAG